ncbi:hypothetical protein EAF00_007948 [Botryotinia globosa]|nr:hypothetical protein EAF00_007948 [Botryotinia globosa]
MADPVGFTASVIGIATLAVQLGDALRKAAEFWEAVQDAPSDIRRLSKQLRLVASVFHTIRLEYETSSIPTNFESMVKDALELAKDNIDQLSELISKLSRNLSIANGSLGRQWRKVQMVLKASKMERFRDNLGSVKTTMASLQGSRQQASLIQVNSRLDVLTTNISSALSIFELFLPLTEYNDDDGIDDADTSTTTKTFLVELLMGFTTCRKGFRFMATSNFDRYALDVVRRRSDDSEIFKLCRNGNFQAVRRLLDRGEASIHDVDEGGRSLLHITVSCDNWQLSTMLLDVGADLYWEDDDGHLPVSMAKALTSFATLFEAGFELWPLYLSGSGTPLYSILNISVWGYIFQHKPAQSIGGKFASFMEWSFYQTEDAEVLDFLVARFAEELFQLETPDPYYNRGLAKHMIFAVVDKWLESLFRLWFYGKENSTLFLFEYKLSLILRQLLMPSSSRESNEELLPRIISGTYIDGVVNIIKACLWSVGITNALFRIWSKPFFELGIDLFPHHPRTESDGQTNSDRGGSDGKNIAKNYFKGHIIHCCKDINYSIFHEHQQDNLSLEIDVTTLPEYSHLDPLFLCEAGRKRRDSKGAGRCLSQVDEAFIESGKFSMDMPGQWEEPLVPNAAMELTLYSPFYGRHQIFYSMIHESGYGYYTITEQDIQQLEEDLENGTLHHAGLSEDLPKTSGEE